MHHNLSRIRDYHRVIQVAEGNRGHSLRAMEALLFALMRFLKTEGHLVECLGEDPDLILMFDRHCLVQASRANLFRMVRKPLQRSQHKGYHSLYEQQCE